LPCDVRARIADGTPPGDLGILVTDGGAYHERLVEPLVRRAERHVAHSLELAFTDDYAGAHWLGSFVLYLLTTEGGGIAPR
jgi:hypothetical protein